MKKIGIYGGSFDPVHLGHMGLAVQAEKQLELNKVVFIPAKYQPFKLNREVASDEHRVNMLKEAVKGYDSFEISCSELESNEISYTFNTIQRIKKLYSDDTQIYFMLGTDSFLSIELWYRAEELLKACSFAVGIRPGDKEEQLEACINRVKSRYNTHVVLLRNKELKISSTEIKNNIRNGKSIGAFVPEAVERYIYENGLYR